MFNAVVVGVVIMMLLGFLRVNIILSIIIGAIASGLSAHMSLINAFNAFNQGLNNGASIAISYALLGAFASGLAYSNVPAWAVNRISNTIKNNIKKKKSKSSIYLLFTGIWALAFSSQNIVPIHIAFIPILIPPLLPLLNQLKIDRRIIVCLLVMGLCGTYLIVPYGFGDIYINQILHHNLVKNGVTISSQLLPFGMMIPVIGMAIGLVIAIKFTYRKPRSYYESNGNDKFNNNTDPNPSKITIISVILSMTVALVLQTYTNSILAGAVTGCLILIFTKVINFKTSDSVFTEGLKSMAFAGFVMMAASGFSEVLRQTGDIQSLVNIIGHTFETHRNLVVGFMLLIGLAVSVGVGSSFSTVPILATLFVPLCVHLHFSPLATAVLLGTSSALGDVSSPVSDSVIGPTMGLAIDEQHHHIKDGAIPTLIHFALPMFIITWFAVVYIL